MSGPASAGDTVALLTPSYRGDLERCEFLCDSVERHLGDRVPHYLIVHDEDVELFAHLVRPGRSVLPASRFLPKALKRIPLLRWRKRRYWWVPGARPVSGWHTQQIVKIQAAATLPHERFCMVDSDNIFFRDFPPSRLASPEPLPFLVHPGAITPAQARHAAWRAAAQRLLGLPAPTWPADDYIDQIILWDGATVRAMLARIEAKTERGWVQALCREHEFSEYIVYGTFVTSCGTPPNPHVPTTESFCSAHWDPNRLDEDRILAMMRGASDRQVALCVQSFGETPPALVNRAVMRYRAESLVDR